jgi:hypothetical protein
MRDATLVIRAQALNGSTGQALRGSTLADPTIKLAALRYR